MINYSKNENFNASVGFRVCSRYCDLKSIWGVAIHPRIVEINLFPVPNVVLFLANW
jgi:hypothetical protein